MWGLTCVPVTTSSTSYTGKHHQTCSFCFHHPRTLIDYPTIWLLLPEVLEIRVEEGKGKKTVEDYFMLTRSILWCCDVYIYLTDSAEAGWHLKWTSWVCPATVISLILSYRQSDQIQTHTFIFQSCGGAPTKIWNYLHLRIIVSFLFFSVIFWNCFTREVLCWWCCMLRLCLAVSKYHHQAHFSVSLPAGLYLLTF